MKYFVECKEANKKGSGVFATKSFSKGELIEECPIIRLTSKEDLQIQKTILGKYVYEWQPNDDAVVLGYGSIYNHSYKPNAIYFRDFKKNLMIYKAYKNINSGEEITINYNGDPQDLQAVEDFIPLPE